MDEVKSVKEGGVKPEPVAQSDIAVIAKAQLLLPERETMVELEPGLGVKIKALTAVELGEVYAEAEEKQLKPQEITTLVLEKAIVEPKLTREEVRRIKASYLNKLLEAVADWSGFKLEGRPAKLPL